MRKVFLTGIVIILCAVTAHAQSALELYNKGISLTTEADELLVNNKAKDRAVFQKALDMWKEAEDDFIKAGEMQYELKQLVTYSRCKINVARASTYEEMAMPDEHIAAAKKAIELWPQLYDLPSLENSVTFYDSKGKQTVKGIAKTGYAFTFFAPRYMIGKYYNTQKQYKESLPYALECSDPRSIPWMRFVGAWVAADDYENLGNDICKSAKAARIMINAALDFTTTSDYIASKMPLGVSCIKKGIKEHCFKEDTLNWMIKTLFELPASWNVRQEGYEIADLSYEAGDKWIQMMVDMVDRSYADKQPETMEKWLQRIDKEKKGYHEYNWQTLDALYIRINDKAREEEARKVLDKKQDPNRTKLAFSTNPLNIIDLQFPLAMDIINGKMGHGFRFNYEANSTKLMLGGANDSMGKLNGWVKFRGYQLGYSMKFFVKKHNENEVEYLGPELRYGHREYLDSIAVLSLGKKPVSSIQSINPTSNSYELTCNYGYLSMRGGFFAEIYCGAGLGYSTLSTTLDTEHFKIFDYRYSPDRWNKVYFVPRAGFRIGFIIG